MWSSQEPAGGAGRFSVFLPRRRRRADHGSSGGECRPDLALHGRGWRIAYLGPDTPVGTLLDTTPALEPRLVVVSATTPRHLSRVRNELRRLSATAPVAVAGAGATAALAESVGATLLSDDPVTEAERVASRPSP